MRLAVLCACSPIACMWVPPLAFPGRGAKEANLYTEVAEGIHPYGVTSHRHGQSLPPGQSFRYCHSFTPPGQSLPQR